MPFPQLISQRKIDEIINQLLENTKGDQDLTKTAVGDVKAAEDAILRAAFDNTIKPYP